MGLEGQVIPEMTDAFVDSVTDRYVALYEQVTGRAFVRRKRPTPCFAFRTTLQRGAKALKQAPWREDAIQTVRALKAGGVVLYPTDTVRGLGCRADDAGALDKLYQLKGRPGGQPSLVLVDVEGLLEEYANPVPDIAWDLLRESRGPDSRP